MLSQMYRYRPVQHQIFLSHFNESEFSRIVVEKCLNIKFHEFGRAGDVTKLIVASCNFANAQKKKNVKMQLILFINFSGILYHIIWTSLNESRLDSGMNNRKVATAFSATPYIYIYTGCNRRNGPDFGRVFLMLYCTDITQNTYVQSRTVTEIIAREKCGLHRSRRIIRRP